MSTGKKKVSLLISLFHLNMIFYLKKKKKETKKNSDSKTSSPRRELGVPLYSLGWSLAVSGAAVLLHAAAPGQWVSP